jgi:hypothetical protein
MANIEGTEQEEPWFSVVFFRCSSSFFSLPDVFFHLALSPEGTRKKVYKLRTGFYHIAKKANVPVVMVAMDFFNRTVVFTEPFFLSDDEQADKRKIIDFFKDFKGFVPEYSITADIEC